jgi:septum formation protein
MNPSMSVDAFILASGSATRAKILRNAGLVFTVQRPTIDEASVREQMIGDGASVEAGALRLAELKTLEIATRNPRSIVIGADQILECDGEWYEKPGGTEEAREQLKRLEGRNHRLISAVSIAREGEIIWRETDEATLRLRHLSDVFLERYLGIMGDQVSASVGGYQVEGLGAQLFEDVRGDHYTILGLPLWPTLGFLRSIGVLEE